MHTNGLLHIGVVRNGLPDELVGEVAEHDGSAFHVVDDDGDVRPQRVVFYERQQVHVRLVVPLERMDRLQSVNVLDMDLRVLPRLPRRYERQVGHG